MSQQMSVGLYIRLSKEDDKDGPSESVTNQQALLKQYVSDHRLTVYDTYIDDGWSGCNFDRPAFSRMLADIESGKVNTVITKDLSRLGRDYILTGHYLERYFPEHHVRYISLLDGIDTGINSAANDITPFHAIMNDLYARDISKKITAVKRDKQRRGEFIGGKPVFGYRMHPTEKNRIITDEDAATIVQRIFTMALSGISCRAIASALNSEGIPSPAVYARQANIGQWSGERISEMLQNETYLGNMVQGRRIKASYKSRKCLRQRKEDWIVVPSTHEAIVEAETFHAVQRILATRKRTRSRTYSHPLKGILFCHTCEHPLGIINRKNAAGEDTLYFLCRTCQRSEGTSRHAPCVKAKIITDIVASSIRKSCRSELAISTLLPVARKLIDTEPSLNSTADFTSLTLQLQQINTQIDRICLDRMNGLLCEDDYRRIYQQLCNKRSTIKERLFSVNTPKSATDSLELAQSLTEQFLQEISSNREILSMLIDRIYLTEDKQLHIHFRFSTPDDFHMS